LFQKPSIKQVLTWSAIAVLGVVFLRQRIPPAVRTILDIPVEMEFAFVPWLLLTAYWLVQERNSATKETSESRASRLVHVVLVNGALVLLFLQWPGLTRRFLPANAFLTATGLALDFAFVSLAIWARATLGRNWSAEVRIATEHRLVRSGPYCRLRHPIYTAVLGMYAGTMLVSGQLHAALALVVVTAAYCRKLRLEEAVLTKTFGDEYAAYRRETWALVPPLF